ncbi:MAG: hypothetical protein QW717_01800 [Candidatus Bathyarchaeia archaeon]
MAKCPKCGGEASNPFKIWTVSPGKPSKTASKLMAIFECPVCKLKFRKTIEAEGGVKETVSIKNMVERINVIKVELMQTLKNLREKIKTLETERANLMVEIEKLKKAAESRVSALESEVNMLKEEVKSLRELLGYAEEKEK